MILQHHLYTAPVRSSEAVPIQHRIEQERRDRLERMRRAAATPPVKAVTVRPFRPVDRAEAGWPDYHELVPYETMQFGPRPPRKVTAKDIIDQVTIKYGVSREDIASERRRQPIVAARREAAWRMRHELKIMGRQISLPEIARHLGKRDHTTVLYNIRIYEAMLATGDGEANS